MKYLQTGILSAALLLLSVLTGSCLRGKVISSVPETVTLPGSSFVMLGLPAATVPAGPTGRVILEEGRPDYLVVEKPFQLAETNVTWDLWREVYQWGETHGYRFARPGQMGSEGTGEGMNGRHPVTVVDWYSAMVWCNALTEYANSSTGTELDPVYTYQGRVVRDATDQTTCDAAVSSLTADGFRLPTGPEWELASRYAGRERRPGYREYPPNSGIFWRPWLEVSGEIEGSIGTPGAERGRIVSTEVKETPVNTLGFYGMAGPEGKLWQWCWEFIGTRGTDPIHLKEGGSRGPRCSRHDRWPHTRWSPTCGGYDQITFRVARTVTP